jgi:NAD(P)-dependent dehydrogenase (short-subunit alcohol dehydrogenase family)
VRTAVDDVVDSLGTVDVLVNNAQDFCFGPLLHIDADAVDAGWRSGPLATLAFMRACHPHLAGGGSVLNLSSGATVDPNLAGTGVYAAVKAAIAALTRAAAVEWAEDGIRVNALIPFGASPAVEAGLSDEATRAAVLGQVPLARIGDCEADIGPAAVYLAGDGARYVTGTTLSVDGGSSWLH